MAIKPNQSFLVDSVDQSLVTPDEREKKRKERERLAKEAALRNFIGAQAQNRIKAADEFEQQAGAAIPIEDVQSFRPQAAPAPQLGDIHGPERPPKKEPLDSLMGGSFLDDQYISGDEATTRTMSKIQRGGERLGEDMAKYGERIGGFGTVEHAKEYVALNGLSVFSRLMHTMGIMPEEEFRQKYKETYGDEYLNDKEFYDLEKSLLSDKRVQADPTGPAAVGREIERLKYQQMNDLEKNVHLVGELFKVMPSIVDKVGQDLETFVEGYKKSIKSARSGHTERSNVEFSQATDALLDLPSEVFTEMGRDFMGMGLGGAGYISRHPEAQLSAVPVAGFMKGLVKAGKAYKMARKSGVPQQRPATFREVKLQQWEPEARPGQWLEGPTADIPTGRFKETGRVIEVEKKIRSLDDPFIEMIKEMPVEQGRKLLEKYNDSLTEIHIRKPANRREALKFAREMARREYNSFNIGYLDKALSEGTRKILEVVKFDETRELLGLPIESAIAKTMRGLVDPSFNIDPEIWKKVQSMADDSEKFIQAIIDHLEPMGVFDEHQRRLMKDAMTLGMDQQVMDAVTGVMQLRKLLLVEQEALKNAGLVDSAVFSAETKRLQELMTEANRLGEEAEQLATLSAQGRATQSHFEHVLDNTKRIKNQFVDEAALEVIPGDDAASVAARQQGLLGEQQAIEGSQQVARELDEIARMGPYDDTMPDTGPSKEFSAGDRALRPVTELAPDEEAYGVSGAAAARAAEGAASPASMELEALKALRTEGEIRGIGLVDDDDPVGSVRASELEEAAMDKKMEATVARSSEELAEVYVNKLLDSVFSDDNYGLPSGSIGRIIDDYADQAGSMISSYDKLHRWKIEYTSLAIRETLKEFKALLGSRLSKAHRAEISEAAIRYAEQVMGDLKRGQIMSPKLPANLPYKGVRIKERSTVADVRPDGPNKAGNFVYGQDDGTVKRLKGDAKLNFRGPQVKQKRDGAIENEVSDLLLGVGFVGSNASELRDARPGRAPGLEAESKEYAAGAKRLRKAEQIGRVGSLPVSTPEIRASKRLYEAEAKDARKVTGPYEEAREIRGDAPRLPMDESELAAAERQRAALSPAYDERLSDRNREVWKENRQENLDYQDRADQYHHDTVARLEKIIRLGEFIGDEHTRLGKQGALDARTQAWRETVDKARRELAELSNDYDPGVYKTRYTEAQLAGPELPRRLRADPRVPMDKIPEGLNLPSHWRSNNRLGRSRAQVLFREIAEMDWQASKKAVEQARREGKTIEYGVAEEGAILHPINKHPEAQRFPADDQFFDEFPEITPDERMAGSAEYPGGYGYRSTEQIMADYERTLELLELPEEMNPFLKDIRKKMETELVPLEEHMRAGTLDHDFRGTPEEILTFIKKMRSADVLIPIRSPVKNLDRDVYTPAGPPRTGIKERAYIDSDTPGYTGRFPGPAENIDPEAAATLHGTRSFIPDERHIRDMRDVEEMRKNRDSLSDEAEDALDEFEEAERGGLDIFFEDSPESKWLRKADFDRRSAAHDAERLSAVRRSQATGRKFYDDPKDFLEGQVGKPPRMMSTDLETGRPIARYADPDERGPDIRQIDEQIKESDVIRDLEDLQKKRQELLEQRSKIEWANAKATTKSGRKSRRTNTEVAAADAKKARKAADRHAEKVKSLAGKAILNNQKLDAVARLLGDEIIDDNIVKQLFAKIDEGRTDRAKKFTDSERAAGIETMAEVLATANAKKLIRFSYVDADGASRPIDTLAFFLSDPKKLRSDIDPGTIKAALNEDAIDAAIFAGHLTGEDAVFLRDNVELAQTIRQDLSKLMKDSQGTIVSTSKGGKPQYFGSDEMFISNLSTYWPYTQRRRYFGLNDLKQSAKKKRLEKIAEHEGISVNELKASPGFANVFDSFQTPSGSGDLKGLRRAWVKRSGLNADEMDRRFGLTDDLLTGVQQAYFRAKRANEVYKTIMWIEEFLEKQGKIPAKWPKAEDGSAQVGWARLDGSTHDINGKKYDAYGSLQGKIVPQQVKSAIDSMRIDVGIENGIADRVGRWARSKLTVPFKLMKTLANPTYFANLVTGFTMGHLYHGGTPFDLFTGMHSVKTNDQFAKGYLGTGMAPRQIAGGYAFDPQRGKGIESTTAGDALTAFTPGGGLIRSLVQLPSVDSALRSIFGLQSKPGNKLGIGSEAKKMITDAKEFLNPLGEMEYDRAYRTSGWQKFGHLAENLYGDVAELATSGESLAKVSNFMDVSSRVATFKRLVLTEAKAQAGSRNARAIQQAVDRILSNDDLSRHLAERANYENIDYRNLPNWHKGLARNSPYHPFHAYYVRSTMKMLGLPFEYPGRTNILLKAGTDDRDMSIEEIIRLMPAHEKEMFYRMPFQDREMLVSMAFSALADPTQLMPARLMGLLMGPETPEARLQYDAAESFMEKVGVLAGETFWNRPPGVSRLAPALGSYVKGDAARAVNDSLSVLPNYAYYLGALEEAQEVGQTASRQRLTPDLLLLRLIGVKAYRVHGGLMRYDDAYRRLIREKRKRLKDSLKRTMSEAKRAQLKEDYAQQVLRLHDARQGVKHRGAFP